MPSHNLHVSSERHGPIRMYVEKIIVSVRPFLAMFVLASATSARSQTTLENAINTNTFVGRAAPPFFVTTLDGKQVSLANFKGKALIVNFWATWCGACRVEMPWLAQLREQYFKNGFEVIGIVTDAATETKIRQIADKYGVKYLVARCNHKTAQAYGGLPYLPESLYIDKSGKIVLTEAGATSKDEIEENIRKLLGLGAK